MMADEDVYTPTRREQADTSYIRFVNANMARYIEINRRPRGLFVQKKKDKYIGIRNLTGAIWKKEFEDKMSCFDWLMKGHSQQSAATEERRNFAYGELA